jgi:HEAT repeat protein
MIWIHLRRLRARDGAARARAAHWLSQRGSARAVEPLGRALGDRAWSDRWAAAAALGKLGNGRGAPFLAEALATDQDVDVRCSAAWALGRIGGKTVVEPLIEALRDADDSVRRVAVEALAEAGTPAALAALSRGLSDRHHDVRLAVVRALGAAGNGRSAAALIAALGDREWSVRSAAADALAALDDSSALPALREALAGSDLAARLAAAEALGRIGDPRAVEPLVASLQGDLQCCDLRLRRNVAKALGEIGKAEALAALVELVADPHTAGVAAESMVKVLRRDGASAPAERLRRVSRLDGVQQVPWMIDEAEEAATGRLIVRVGRAWAIDTAELRELALDEMRRRENNR